MILIDLMLGDLEFTSAINKTGFGRNAVVHGGGT